MANRTFINTEETYYTSIDDFSKDIKPSKFYGKFFYYKCDTCGEVKSKRMYSTKTDLNVDFTCRECKYKKTSIEKYGVQNPSMKKEICMKKFDTMMERYGTVSTAQFIDYSKMDFQARNEKSRKTCLEKYGVENVAQADCIKEKMRQTCLEKYGTEFPQKLEEVKNRAKETIIDKYGSYRNSPTYKYRQSNQTEEDTAKRKRAVRIFGGKSKQETEIGDYIKIIYNGTILEHKRRYLEGKELDFYLPDLNLAIEYNGIFWHGFNGHTKVSKEDYLKSLDEKYNLCKSKGIKLLTIGEEDFLLYKEAVFEKIRNEISPKEELNCEDCQLKDISYDTAAEFCSHYLIGDIKQENDNLGIFYNEKLIGVVSFENKTLILSIKTGYKISNILEWIHKNLDKEFVYYVNLKYDEGNRNTDFDYKFYVYHRVVNRQDLTWDNLNYYCLQIYDNLSIEENVIRNNGTLIYNLGYEMKYFKK